MIDILRSAAEVREHVRRLHREGKRLALVPTMGFLHEGHLSLMREGLRHADVCAASIFVNPTQFGPNEDLARYPRDEGGDVEKCASAGVSFVWAPSVEEVYPKGAQTFVECTEITKEHCGRMRPGHFRGVTTVVAKLFAVFRPDVAVFGEKDFQQLQVIRRMNRDLGFGVEIVGGALVRDPDGLAMSSRNTFLSPDDRRRALALSRGLFRAAQACAAGERDAGQLLSLARKELAAREVEEQYLVVVDPETMAPLERVEREARMLGAAHVGPTRLIDNFALIPPA